MVTQIEIVLLSIAAPLIGGLSVWVIAIALSELVLKLQKAKREHED